MCKAKEALNLELSQDDRLAPLLEELRDLKGVWTELGRVWQVRREKEKKNFFLLFSARS